MNYKLKNENIEIERTESQNKALADVAIDIFSKAIHLADVDSKFHKIPFRPLVTRHIIEHGDLVDNFGLHTTADKRESKNKLSNAFKDEFLLYRSMTRLISSTAERLEEKLQEKVYSGPKMPNLIFEKTSDENISNLYLHFGEDIMSDSTSKEQHSLGNLGEMENNHSLENIKNVYVGHLGIAPSNHVKITPFYIDYVANNIYSPTPLINTHSVTMTLFYIYMSIRDHEEKNGLPLTRLRRKVAYHLMTLTEVNEGNLIKGVIETNSRTEIIVNKNILLANKESVGDTVGFLTLPLLGYKTPLTVKEYLAVKEKCLNSYNKVISDHRARTVNNEILTVREFFSDYKKLIEEFTPAMEKRMFKFDDLTEFDILKMFMTEIKKMSVDIKTNHALVTEMIYTNVIFKDRDFGRFLRDCRSYKDEHFETKVGKAFFMLIIRKVGGNV